MVIDLEFFSLSPTISSFSATASMVRCTEGFEIGHKDLAKALRLERLVNRNSS
jgi:hypothetical protein